MRKLLHPAICLMLLSLLTACIPHGIVKGRLDVIEDKAACTARTDTLLVLLPGAYDTPQDFIDQGFISALRQRRLAADIVVADTHFGYFKARSVVERLHEDIIIPAREAGYRRIWLVGVSLGGYGSLLYAKQHGEQIAGIFLIAPYLGNDAVLREVASAGGLASWQAGDADSEDIDRGLWAWLKTYGQPGGKNLKGLPHLHIGYGSADRFADGNRLLANALPAAQVMTTEGGHDWQPWRRLWDDFLDRTSLPACAAPFGSPAT